MAHEVEGWLFVELIGSRVNNDWRIDVIQRPIWATLHVEAQIPVRPSDDPVEHVLDDGMTVGFAAKPRAKLWAV